MLLLGNEIFAILKCDECFLFHCFGFFNTEMLNSLHKDINKQPDLHLCKLLTFDCKSSYDTNEKLKNTK